MARKVSKFTVQTEGRDKGKLFVLTEMSASRAEDWGIRALLALASSGVELPDDVQGMGMAGIAVMGIQALSGMRYEAAKPLLDEMFECVEICPEPSKPNVVRALIEDDIEEPGTRLQLRKAILELHVDFSKAGAQSSQMGLATPDSPAPSRITRTSPAR
jgi:hypothetical protein